MLREENGGACGFISTLVDFGNIGDASAEFEEVGKAEQ
jgi:hypothetical protein